jgi:hypothetical protein
VAFERAGARRRRSRTRPAIDPADEEGGADRPCWGRWIASSDLMREENWGEGRRIGEVGGCLQARLDRLKFFQLTHWWEHKIYIPRK